MHMCPEPGSEARDVTPVRLEDDPLAVSIHWQPPQRPNGHITGNNNTTFKTVMLKVALKNEIIRRKGAFLFLPYSF